MKLINVRTLAHAGAFAAAVLLAGSASATTKDEYRAAKDRIGSEYKAAKAKCDALSGQPKNLCQAEAKAAERRAKARAEADYENTPKAREKAVIADAEATYMVAKEQCSTKTGNDKDVCVKAAKAAETKAKADAKAARQTTVAKAGAADTKRDADYKVAREKCDPLTGAAKDKCVADAKARFAR
ncbi:MAG TPA: hypothetical protein VM937_00665 [Burkholderiaceae bacterium]|jgi:hypothetical protein|nr:hypothetical protein [Burkholderiaceae bacterium]